VRVLLDEQHRDACSRLMRAMIPKMSCTTSGASPSDGSSSRSGGLADDRAADREHLLLAAREIPGELLPALAQAREVAEDELGVDLDALPAGERVACGDQVLLDRQVAEDVAALPARARGPARASL
jgi:hypothetical protein